MAFGVLQKIASSIAGPLLGMMKNQPDPEDYRTPPFNPNAPMPTNPRMTRQSPLDVYDEVGDIEAPGAYSDLLGHLRNMPTRTNPHPLRAIGTGLYSYLQPKPLNVEQAGDVLYLPHERRMVDWENKAKALTAAANIEKTLESNRALAAQRRAQAEQGIPALAAQRTARAEDIPQRLQLDRAKHELNQWKTRNPNGKVVAPKGGNITVINPQTGEAIDTGVPTGSLTDEERINLTSEKRTEQIGTIGEQQRQTLGQRGEQALKEIAARGTEARKTRATTSGGAGTTSQLPTQQKVAAQLRANQAIQEHPEWADFIEVNPNTGMVQILPAGDRWFGSDLDVDTRNQIIAYLGGAPTAKTPTKPGPPVKAATTGKVIKQYSPSRNQTRISNDGGKTWKIVQGRQ